MADRKKQIRQFVPFITGLCSKILGNLFSVDDDDNSRMMDRILHPLTYAHRVGERIYMAEKRVA